jgi:hypothetical protein
VAADAWSVTGLQSKSSETIAQIGLTQCSVSNVSFPADWRTQPKNRFQIEKSRDRLDQQAYQSRRKPIRNKSIEWFSEVSVMFVVGSGVFYRRWSKEVQQTEKQ